MTTSLTRQKAEAHEKLYPALAKLTAQLEALALRQPAARVPAATRTAATDLLYEAQSFGWDGRNRTRRSLPEPAADMAGLATQLGQALALLDAWEAAHIAWNGDLKCFAWLLVDPLPVKRLRPQTTAIVKTAAQQREADHMRQKIIRRFAEKFEDGYDAGYADASSGHEHRGASS